MGFDTLSETLIEIHGDYVLYRCENAQPDVDIIMPVYNQEKYVAKAIDSILEQNTSYSYRILIGEDCSTDNSRDIVKQYYKRYPDKIELILCNKNTKGVLNSRKMYENARAPYLAFLDGDDYWININKLQIQVDFLKHNSEYYASCHNIAVVDENDSLRSGEGLPWLFKVGYVFGAESFLGIPAQIGSYVSRNFFLEFSNEQLDIFCNTKSHGDIKTNAIIASMGKVRYLEAIMSVYRRQYSGNSYNARIANKNVLFHEYCVLNAIPAMLEKLGVNVMYSKGIRYKQYRKKAYEEMLSNFKYKNIIVYLSFLFVKKERV